MFHRKFFDKAYWQRWLVGIESLDEKALRNLISDEEGVVIHDEIDKKSHVVLITDGVVSGEEIDKAMETTSDRKVICPSGSTIKRKHEMLLHTSDSINVAPLYFAVSSDEALNGFNDDGDGSLLEIFPGVEALKLLPK